MVKYEIQERKTGNIIDEFSSIEDARKALENYENEGKENFYDIIMTKEYHQKIKITKLEINEEFNSINNSDFDYLGEDSEGIRIVPFEQYGPDFEYKRTNDYSWSILAIEKGWSIYSISTYFSVDNWFIVKEGKLMSYRSMYESDKELQSFDEFKFALNQANLSLSESDENEIFNNFFKKQLINKK